MLPESKIQRIKHLQLQGSEQASLMQGVSLREVEKIYNEEKVFNDENVYEKSIKKCAKYFGEK